MKPKILKQDVDNKKHQILAYLDRLGFNVTIYVDGRRRSVYVGDTMFTFEEFMSIDMNSFMLIYLIKKNKNK